MSSAEADFFSRRISTGNRPKAQECHYAHFATAIHLSV
jgi:hypothetical protein